MSAGYLHSYDLVIDKLCAAIYLTDFWCLSPFLVMGNIFFTPRQIPGITLLLYLTLIVDLKHDEPVKVRVRYCCWLCMHTATTVAHSMQY